MMPKYRNNTKLTMIQKLQIDTKLHNDTTITIIPKNYNDTKKAY